MTTVHQLVPTFEPGAVGHHIEAVRAVLRDAGIGGEVFAEHIHPAMDGRAHSFTDYGTAFPAAPGDVLVYHLAIGSVVGSFVAERGEPVVVWYHNVTPPEYLMPWEPRATPGVRWGRRQMVELGGRASFAIADSEFNRTELVAAGYRDTAVVPIILDRAALDCAPDPGTAAHLRAAKQIGGADLLFVGRIVPNKCQHELVQLLAALRAGYNERARLRLVGAGSLERYERSVLDLADALGLADAVEIIGSVSQAALNAYYENADVLVSLSEHEGFCVPLIEAMHHGVPVVAYDAAAVPDTLGDAGILLAKKSPTVAAGAVARVLRDADVRAGLIAAGHARFADFAPTVTAQRLLEVLARHGLTGDGVATAAS